MGYSAGGDGVFQIAPRMADHWAAAAMMAGHPGDAAALNLRNLPFTIFMGGLMLLTSAMNWLLCGGKDWTAWKASIRAAISMICISILECPIG
jgi:poly(3-hydroxybutyrate) depolymerase